MIFGSANQNLGGAVSGTAARTIAGSRLQGDGDNWLSTRATPGPDHDQAEEPAQ